MGDLIKVITLKEPWASLVASGDKPFETRSWDTKHRGIIAIHASKNTCREDYDFAWYSTLVRRALTNACVPINGGPKGLVKDAFPDTRGRILAVGLLRVTGRMEAMQPGYQIHMSRGDVVTVTEKDFVLGHWASDRHFWLITDIRKLERPVPVTGAQGLWEWEANDEVQPWLSELRQLDSPTKL